MPTSTLPSDRATVEPALQDATAEGRSFVRSAVVFVLIGLALYGALYAAAESLVYRYAERNRFYAVQNAGDERFDYVFLGASHAAVFDYRDMNDRLEAMTGARILNLATVGGGLTINRFLLEYFLERGDADAVVYFADSFAFYSRDWNEERVADTELYMRAPWDPSLAAMLLREPATRRVALDYISGFSKINNPDRFKLDRFEAEDARFDRQYRAVPQIDRQRMAFLYPSAVDETTLANSPYLAEFQELIEYVRARGTRFIVVRPPLPERIHAMLPHEALFDATIREVATRAGAEFHDFTFVNNAPEFFYDSDHLNEAGVLSFFENHLADVLRRGGAAGAP